MADNKEFERAFNNEWITPRELVRDLETDYDFPREFVMKRLQLGIIKAVARAGPNPDHGVSPFVPVPAQLWPKLLEHEEFWDSGDATFSVGAVTGYGDWVHLIFIGIRFDPKSITSNAPTDVDYSDDMTVPENPTPAITIKSKEAHPNNIEAKQKDRIGNQDLKKVSKLIAELWGEEITDLEALARARRLIDDKHIAEKRFLEEYRLIRPTKKPGPKPASGK